MPVCPLRTVFARSGITSCEAHSRSELTPHRLCLISARSPDTMDVRMHPQLLQMFGSSQVILQPNTGEFFLSGPLKPQANVPSFPQTSSPPKLCWLVSVEPTLKSENKPKCQKTSLPFRLHLPPCRRLTFAAVSVVGFCKFLSVFDSRVSFPLPFNCFVACVLHRRPPHRRPERLRSLPGLHARLHARVAHLPQPVPGDRRSPAGIRPANPGQPGLLSGSAPGGCAGPGSAGDRAEAPGGRCRHGPLLSGPDRPQECWRRVRVGLLCDWKDGWGLSTRATAAIPRRRCSPLFGAWFGFNGAVAVAPLERTGVCQTG